MNDVNDAQCRHLVKAA